MADTQQTISIFYDNSDPQSDLANHSMGLSELSSALQGLCGVISDANKIINGKESEIKVRIRAGGFEKGSFGIPLEIIQSATDADVLRSIGLVTTGGSIILAGVLSKIQKFKGRSIRSIKRIAKNGTYQLKIDGEIIECSHVEKRLLTDKSFRKHVDMVFNQPMRGGAADTIRINLNSDEEVATLPLELNKKEAQNLATSEDMYMTEVEEDDFDARVRFKSAYAEKSGGWIVDIHGKNRKVEILDQAFLSKLNSDSSNFSFGREFDVILRETTTTKAGSNRKSKSYSIVKVF